MKPSIRISKIENLLHIQTIGFILGFRQILQEVTIADWNDKVKRWVIDYQPEYIEQLQLIFNIRYDKCSDIIPNYFENNTKLPIIKKISSLTTLQEIEKFKMWLRSKRYSENTVKTYSEALKSFLDYFEEKPISEINNDDIILYNNEYILKNNLSSSYQNQVTNAIKLYFRTIRETKIEFEKIHRPKQEKLLPNVLSKEEIKSILQAHSNIKHKTMLSLIYSCGLRRSELLHLKPTDIDSKRNIVIIRQSKGKKDRITPLSPKILKLLRDYYKVYKPKIYLFEGQNKSERYSEKSLENVLKQALTKCNIIKPVSLHWLRHSYATHLLESGTDLRYIQELLGHNSSRTTEIYTHVSTKSIQQIKSPFDDL
jgi:integrase/recombinase XerD